MEAGTREIVLIGQDTGVWGCDLADDDSLASLLRRLGALVAPYGGWLRVLYLQPEGMTDELVSAIRDVPEVLPYIDIPIQHCSERILSRMNRSGSSEEYGRLFERLRSEIPGMVLRTTALVGFPGETDDEVDDLVEFLDREKVDYCSVFSYSPEEGTVACRMEDQIPDDVKLERAQRLIDTAEQLGFDATARHVGETCDVIIDGVESTDDGEELIGHTWFQAPDSDGAVHIAEGSVSVGDVVTCRLTDSFCYELEGELVGGDRR
jgi:ribosomal protein S12 methylthiotransferase